MPKYNFIHNAFSAGELSPNVWGRTDLPQYFQGLKTLKNFFVQPAGGARGRPGTIHVPSALSLGTQGTNTRLFPFVFSKTESYCVVLTANSAASLADSLKIINTSTKAVLSPGDGIFLQDLPFSSSSALSDLWEIQWAQSADVMYMTAPNFPPVRLKRLAANSFEMISVLDEREFANNLLFFNSIPFQDYNKDSAHDAYVSNGAVSEPIVARTLTFDKATKMGRGQYIRIDDQSNNVSGLAKKIDATATSTTHSVEILVAFGATAVGSPGEPKWKLSVWGGEGDATAAPGYPRSLTFFGSRLIYGGNQTFPDTFVGSEVFNFDRFMRTDVSASTSPAQSVALQTGNAAAFKFTLASRQVNQINFMESVGSNMVIGTLGGEYSAFGADSSAGFGPTNPQVVRNTNIGSSFIQPTFAFNSMIYVDRTGKTLRSIDFNAEANSFIPENLNLLADHMINRNYDVHTFNLGDDPIIQFRQLDYQATPNSVVWSIDETGSLFALTLERNTQLVAWSQMQIGGIYTQSSLNEEPLVRSVAVMPSGDGTSDDVWLAVTRTVGGVDVTTIEYMTREFERSRIYVDSSEIRDKMVYADSVELSQQSTVVTLTTDDVVVSSTLTSASSADLVPAGLDKIGLVAHGLSDGYRIKYSTTGTAIGGLVNGNHYYLVNSTTNTFQLSHTLSGSVIALSGFGTGTHSFVFAGAINSTTHGFSDGDFFKYTTTGLPFGGLADEQVYKVILIDANNFSLGLNLITDAISITAGGSGSHSARKAVTQHHGFVHMVGDAVDVLADGVFAGSITVTGTDNYITNPDAETNTTGWSTFLDTAGVDETTAAGLVTEATDLINSTGHGIPANTKVRYYTDTGAISAEINGLITDRIYFLVNPNANDFQMAKTSGGTAIDLKDDGAASVVHTFEPWEPIDGTGGSPTITLSRITSGTITGTGSFQISVGTGNQSGQGVSTDFTIDAGMKGKECEITFKHVADLAPTPNALRCFVYDVTNTSLIYPSQIYIDLSTTQQTFKTTFKAASDSTSYRLIFFVPHVNVTSGFVWKFDDVVVRGASITVGEPSSEVVAGYNYRPTLETLQLEAGSAIGSAQGGKARVDRLVIRFNKTVGAKYGRDSANLFEIPFREATVQMSKPTPLFTGDKIVEFNGDWGAENRVYIEQDKPLPITVNALVIRGVLNEG